MEKSRQKEEANGYLLLELCVVLAARLKLLTDHIQARHASFDPYIHMTVRASRLVLCEALVRRRGLLTFRRFGLLALRGLELHHLLSKKFLAVLLGDGNSFALGAHLTDLKLEPRSGRSSFCLLRRNLRLKLASLLRRKICGSEGIASAETPREVYKQAATRYKHIATPHELTRCDCSS